MGSLFITLDEQTRHLQQFDFVEEEVSWNHDGKSNLCCISGFDVDLLRQLRTRTRQKGWEFDDEKAVDIDWKEFQELGTWYLYAQYIDPPRLMTNDPMPLVPAYDCGKIEVKNYNSKTYPYVLKPKFYTARYSYSDVLDQEQLNNETARAWEGHSTLKDKNMDSPDFP